MFLDHGVDKLASMSDQTTGNNFIFKVKDKSLLFDIPVFVYQVEQVV